MVGDGSGTELAEQVRLVTSGAAVRLATDAAKA
jgi:hypothetical protein